MRVPVPDDLILGLLADRRRHGYELLVQFERPEELGRVWTMSRSQVYAVLKRLEHRGLIRGRPVRGLAAPDRVEFSLTPAGRRHMEHWLLEEEPSASIRSIRVEFVSRVYIAERLGSSIDPILRNQRAACRDRLAALAQSRSSAGSATERMSLEFVIGQLQAAMTWLDRIEIDGGNRVAAAAARQRG